MFLAVAKTSHIVMAISVDLGTKKSTVRLEVTQTRASVGVAQGSFAVLGLFIYKYAAAGGSRP